MYILILYDVPRSITAYGPFATEKEAADMGAAYAHAYPDVPSFLVTLMDKEAALINLPHTGGQS